MTRSLFVYGTLKRDASGKPHPLLRSAKRLGRASGSGLLYDLGQYPCLVRARSNGHRVFGELYQLDEGALSHVLRALDEYEGREFERRRVYVILPNGQRRAAWTYVLRGRLPRSAQHVSSGRYAKRGVA